MGEGMGEYETAGGGSYVGTQYGVDGPDMSDAQFKQEMADGEGAGEYWTAGGGSMLGADGFKQEMADDEGAGEYWTAGGGSYINADGSVQDNFKTKSVSVDGDVTVKTSNPVYEDSTAQMNEFLSSASGATRRARRRSRRARRRSQGSFLDRVRSGAQKIADSGVLQSVGANFMQGGANTGGFNTMPMSSTPLPTTPMNQRQGMSTTAKVGIVLGVVALAGVGIYLYSKNKGKGKAKK